MQYNIVKIKQQLKRRLDDDRYEHTVGVAYTAMSMAMRYECSLEKAELAGMLHDCAKCISDGAKLNKCSKYNISITNTEKKNPYLLHAKLGAFLAMDKYKVEDQDIINAILYHTTGRPAMSALEKIIYIADFIEPSRSKAPSLKEMRKLAFLDLDQTMYQILKDTIFYLDKKGNVVDELSVKAFKYYEQLEQERLRIQKIKGE